MPDLTDTLGRAGLTVREALAGEEGLDALGASLAREQAIRQIMAETGEPREIVTESIDAMDAMAEEEVLDLCDGQPTTLRDGLSRYVELLGQRDEIVPRDWVLSDLHALLTYAWPAERGNADVDQEDSLERREDEPEGWHRRDTTEAGYPLMGSSPAERAEARERGERIRAQAMRDHLFAGEGRYCEAMLPVGSSGSPETGIITMTAGCGYGRDTHPDRA
jgi:hypothetical protein